MAKKKPTKRRPRKVEPHWLNRDGDTTVQRGRFGMVKIQDNIDGVVILNSSELRELHDWIQVNGFGDEK